MVADFEYILQIKVADLNAGKQFHLDVPGTVLLVRGLPVISS